LKQSNSYIAFQTRTQEIFNFAVLVTSSIPVLKYNLKLLEKGDIKRISEPDYFEPSVIYEIVESTLTDLKANGLDDEKLTRLKEIINRPLNNREFKQCVTERIGVEEYSKNRHIINRQSTEYITNLRECTSDYQTKLASYLYFSLFSYFEAFISDLINEVIENFNKLNVLEYVQTIKSIDREKEIRVLDRTYDARKIDKYKKYSNELRNKGYEEPELLLFSSMIDLLKSSNKNLKANDIPDFLKKFFFFELSTTDNETYHNLRDNRNSLGHGGTSFTPTLRNVINANKFFKRISKDIDSHVTRNYMKLNNYQK
jgi:hypothetical protein